MQELYVAEISRPRLADSVAGCIFIYLTVGAGKKNEKRYRVKRGVNGGYDRSRSFKVIAVGTNRGPVCDFLRVDNSNSGHIEIVPRTLQK